MKMIPRLTEAIEYFIDDLGYPLKACSRFNTAFSEALLEKWNHDTANTQDTDNSQTQITSISESLYSVQFQNSLEDVGQALDNCRHSMVEGVKNLIEKEQGNGATGVSSGQVKWASVMLLLAKELQAYHLAVSNSLVPVVSNLTRHAVQDSVLEDKEKSGIVLAWKSVHEINKQLRTGYGLTDHEVAVILAWMHGEDLSESTRKSLNVQVDSLLQVYKERLGRSAMSELDVPVAFHCDAALMRDVLKDCCSVAEVSSAIGQRIPTNKEELESLLHRELPRIPIIISGVSFETASPGKAFENTKQKMHAVRDIVNEISESQNLSASKEQLDLFCMRVLATVCSSVANAASRVAVLMAFGKANLVQVKPPPTRLDDKQPHISASEGTIDVDVPSSWWLVEDSFLFSSLCREQNRTSPIAVVDATYQVSIDAKSFLERRIEPLPIVHVQRLPFSSPPLSGSKKDQTFQKQFSLRTKLSKATKLFNRRSGIQKSTVKDTTGSAVVTKEEVLEQQAALTHTEGKDKASKETLTEDGKDPVPPPRPRRKARKSKRAKSETLRKERAQQRALEEAKKDTDWFLSTSTKVKSPTVQALKGSKGQKSNASVASFEELQEVIDFLSGSSSSSLCLTGTTDGEKTAAKEAGAVAAKLNKQEMTKEADVPDIKRDSGSEEYNETVEDKGKSSPVDSGLGSTTSFPSSLSCASAVSVLTADHITPSPEQRSLLDEKESEYHSDEKTKTNASLVSGESGKTEDIKQEGNPDYKEERGKTDEKEDRIQEPDVGSELVTHKDGVNDGSIKDIQTGISDEKEEDIADNAMLCSDLEVWKDPGIVEPFECMLEGPDDTDTPEEPSSEHEKGPEEEGHYLPSDSSQPDTDERASSPLPRLTKTLSHPCLKGSTESLYYSAWSLNDFSNKKNEDGSADKEDEQAQSMTESDSGSAKATSEGDAALAQHIQQKCETEGQPFDPFNSSYSWHGIMGENLGMLWSTDGVNPKSLEERKPWPQSHSRPAATGNFATETSSLEGSRLSQWTTSTKSSLGTPLCTPWQSRSNPDVQKTIASTEAKVRFERAPSPLSGSRPEMLTSANWPGSHLTRRGSFPRAFHRDTGSPRESNPYVRENFSPRDHPIVRSDISPSTATRGVPLPYNPTLQGTSQASPVWPGGNDTKYWMRHDTQPGAGQGSPAMASYRNRVSQTVSLPLGNMRPIKDGDSWGKTSPAPSNTFGPGPGITEANVPPGYLGQPTNFVQQDGGGYPLDPNLFLPFHGGAPLRDTNPKRFPMQKRPSFKDPNLEAQLMMQGNRMMPNRNQRADPRFPENFQLWNMPKQ